MWPLYEDIIERAGEPDWWTEKGVPRYGEFKPGITGVYAEAVALCEVDCQGCERVFRVAFDWRRFDVTAGKVVEREEPTGPDDWWMGDPPNPPSHQCAGATMCSETVAVLEHWRRDKHCEWVRDPARERAATPTE
jgi:hypothetical protein